MSWRRVKVLINALPLDAAVFRSDEEMRGWTVTDHLLATVVDTLGVVGYHALVGPHADPKKLRSAKPPERTYRPGVVKTHRKSKRAASSEDLKRIFGGSASYRPKEGN